MRGYARRKSRHPDQKSEVPAPPVAVPADPVATERLSAFYAARPLLRIGAEGLAEPAPDGINSATLLPAVQGAGQPERVVAYNRSLRLQGRTDATFDGGNYRTENVRVARGEGCAGCEAADCIHVTGVIIARYHVDTTVTLPRAADFADLTQCQRQRVQQVIDNVLAPHEQQHVQAFRTYNGSTRRPFDLTICRADFDARIQALFEAEEQARRAAAQAASDALDPFHFDVDLDCEDAPPPRGRSTAAAPAEEE